MKSAENGIPVAFFQLESQSFCQKLISIRSFRCMRFLQSRPSR